MASFLSNVVGQTVQGVTDVQNGINVAINGRPKLVAVDNLFKAMTSYDAKLYGEQLTDDVIWETYPISAKTANQNKAAILDPIIWKGIKNFGMTHVAQPLEVEGDRVVAHTRVVPEATTPGGIPCTNEMFWLISLRNVGGKWKVSYIIEMLDTVARANWIADWTKEKAAAAGGAAVATGTPAGNFSYAELLAAANRFVAAMQTYDVDKFTAVCHTNFVQKFFPYSLNFADRDRATCVSKLHDIWNVVEGITIEILDGATLVDPSQNRVHMHCRAIAPGRGKFTGIHYRNEYTFVMDFAKENNELKVLIWREFVDSAGLNTFFTTENKAVADRKWTAEHPNAK